MNPEFSWLTGDPLSDALVPIAQRLICAVRGEDASSVDQCVADAIDATQGKCDPGTGLAVILAAMVPDHYRPSQLLAWIPDHMRHPYVREDAA